MKFILANLRWLSWLAFVIPVIFLWDFFVLYSDQLILLTWQHLRMIFLAMPMAIVIGVGIGIVIHRSNKSAFVVSVAGVIMTIPSIALFGAMIPFLAPLGMGVGLGPAIVALILYSQLPIIRNTFVGLRNIPPFVVHVARGMGLSRWEILQKVQIPLAVPVILSGIRTAVVLSVGVAAVAAYIGGGGLGRWIFGGIRRTYPEMMFAGAFAVSLLAIFLDFCLAWLQKKLTSPGLTNLTFEEHGHVN